MKVDIKNLKNSQVELTITVPYADYKKAEEKALVILSKEVKADGFRSGHVPEDVIREKAGVEGVINATLDVILPETYSKAIQDNNIQVIARPNVELKTPVQKEGDDLVYVATASIMPEVKVGDWKKIKVAKGEAKVSKKEVDETIKMIEDRFTEWKDVDRKAKDGDRVEATFEGFDEEGKPIPNTASKNHPVILGAKSMIPGFEEAILGMSKDEEKEFDVTFPKEYHAENMKNKKVKFKLSVGRVEEKEVKKLDESMIEKATGKKQTIDEFKKRVEEDLLKEVQGRTKQEHDNKVVQEIVKITKADLPDELIKEEVEYMKQDQKAHIAKQGLQWDQYLKHVKKTEEDFDKDHEKPAKERLLARLGVQTVLKESGIKIEGKDVEIHIKTIADGYPEDQKKQVFEHYKEGSQGYANLKNNLAADKLIEMLTK